MKKRIIGGLLAAVSIFTFGFGITPVYAGELAVTVTTDELDSATDCTDTPADCSLREAIAEANAASEDTTITIPSGTYTIELSNSSGDEDLNATGDFDIGNGTHEISIEGAGMDATIIDANQEDRIFEIKSGSGDVTISDLRVTNGSVSSSISAVSGGGIYVASSVDVTFDSIQVDNNSVSVSSSDSDAVNGGGISSSSNVNLLITNSVVKENSVNRSGSGATGGGGGGIQVNGGNTGTYVVRNSVVSDNEVIATGTQPVLGGGISFNNVPDGVIENTIVSGNTISTAGSASYGSGINIGDGATADIRFSTIIDNSDTDNSAGGIDSNHSSTITAFALILSGNTRGNSAETNCSEQAGGTITSAGYNIESASTCSFAEIGDEDATDPLIDINGLEDNGGDFETIAIQLASPAVDAVPAASCLDADEEAMTTDIRGYTRPENTDCDAGAYELDQTSPTVTLDPSNATLECAVDTYSAPTATVSDNFDTTVTTASEESNNVDEGTAGSYNVVYASTADYDGNIGRGSQPVTVEDTTVPVISVTGETAVTAEAGETYTDSGATVADSCDESISVSTAGTVDTDTLGEYTLTYTATDSEDNAATEKTRTVTVEDTTVPVITLSGESAVTLTVGDSYTDAGATATDSFEGTLTDDITTAGTVDTDTAGTYTITYNVSDSSGNAATEVTRSVTVEVAEEEEEPVEEEEGEEEPVEEEGSEEEEETGTDNDVETGEGDGSEDTAETLGAVESLTRSTDSTVTVEYANGSTKTFQLFGASAKAKVQLHTNGAILIAINKTYMRTFDAFTGEQIDQVKLFKSTQYKTKFKRFNVYKKVPGKNNVMVLAQTKKKHKKQFKLRSFVVKNGGKITKRPYRTIRLNKNANFSKLSINKNKKNGKKARILIKKNGKTLKNWKYRVTKKKGIIKKAS